MEQSLPEVRYYGEDPDSERLIIQAVRRLPPKVAGFVSERCHFVTVGHTVWGFTGRPLGLVGQDLKACYESPSLSREAYEQTLADAANHWMVLLTEDISDLSVEDALSLIAHEIAHAWLQHDRFGDHPSDCETQAAGQTKKWGFTGKGADPAYCNR